MRERLKLPDLWTAIRALHFPAPDSDLRMLNAYRTPAHWRLIFEEFFWLECGLSLKRSKARLQPGISFELNDRVREKIKAMLPFKPTGAQKRVLKEIAQDMQAPHPMSRLLQGDVGSGKTLVAAEAAVIAIENGYQAAVLAPTEILASQHYFYFKNLFQKMGYVPVLLTGSSTQREKSQLKKLMAEGLAHIGIGTHALIEEDVEWKNLGLAIVDEQHRFGVMQRLRLVSKAKHPDVLVMTATPIPRTLALTIYGDLDISVIDEMPPGRRPIETSHVTDDRVESVYSFMKQQIAKGRQAYVVYPVIEESEAMKAAQQMYLHLSQKVFPDIRVGLLHGKLKADEKGNGDGAVSPGRSEDPGVHYRDRSRRGCAQRHRDGDRASRAFWPGAAASASRARGTRRRTKLLHPGDGQTGRRRARAHPDHGGVDRWLLHRRNGSEAARSGRIFRNQAIGASRACASPTSFATKTCWSWRARKRRRSSPLLHRRKNFAAQ